MTDKVGKEENDRKSKRDELKERTFIYRERLKVKESLMERLRARENKIKRWREWEGEKEIEK